MNDPWGRLWIGLFLFCYILIGVAGVAFLVSAYRTNLFLGLFATGVMGVFNLIVGTLAWAFLRGDLG